MLACTSVAGLGGGPAGEVATYLPGRRVTGVRVRRTVPAGRWAGRTVIVHVIGRYGRPRPTPPRVAALAVVGPVDVWVWVDDLVLPARSGAAARPTGEVGSPLKYRSPPMVPSLIGLFVGLILGFAAAFGGFIAFVVVAVFAAVGFRVGKVIEGEIDVQSYLTSRGRAPR